jgi:hypothetical protein
MSCFLYQPLLDYRDLEAHSNMGVCVNIAYSYDTQQHTRPYLGPMSESNVSVLTGMMTLDSELAEASSSNALAGRLCPLAEHLGRLVATKTTTPLATLIIVLVRAITEP